MTKKWRYMITAVASVAVAVAMLALLLPGCAPAKPTAAPTTPQVTPAPTTPTAPAPAAPAAPAKKLRLRFPGAGVGGFIYSACLAVGNLVNKYSDKLELAVEASVGTLLTPKMIEGGEVMIAAGSSEGEYNVAKGLADYAGKPGTKTTRLVMLACSSYVAFTLASRNDINSISDLKGKRIGLGNETSPAAQNSKAFLEVNDIKVSITYNTDLNEMLERLRDGIYDACLHGVAHPWAQLLDVARSKGIKLIPMTEEEVKKMMVKSPAATSSLIPTDTYPGQTRDYRAFGGQQDIIASTDLSEALGYEILSILDKHKLEFWTALGPSLNAFGNWDAWNTHVVPLHPGAIKWLKEKGVTVK